MANLGERMFRAAKLDANLYEEVEADKEALGQATAVVVLSSLAAGLGMGMRIGIGGIVIETLVALVVWYIWALLTYWIGTKILPEPQTESDVGELLRTLGFASSPGVIRILGVIPGLQGIVFLISSIWMLIAMVIAVRQALDYRSTGRAIGVCAIGWFVQLVVFGILMGLVGGFSRPM